jgi:hypothetical protein
MRLLDRLTFKPPEAAWIHTVVFKIFVGVFVGAILRHLFLEEMLFQYDEKYMYLAARKIAEEGTWPTLGMHSGVRARNPGMSVWVFGVLAKLFQVADPVALCRAVSWLNTAAIGLLGLFISRKIPKQSQAPWWWAFAIATVNPLLIMYQRKIWAQSVLAFFVVLFFWAYWERRKRLGAFFWGFIGPCLGQIHMSGFFFSLAFFLSSLSRKDRQGVRWGAWFAGSVVGSLPMIPWLVYMRYAPKSATLQGFLLEVSQLRFWSFWFSDPVGLALGNILGLHRGPGQIEQNSDFMRYPIIGSISTYGVGIFMVGSLLIFLWVMGAAGWKLIKRETHRKSEAFDPETHSAVWAAGGIYGLALFFSFAHIRRYYLLVTFPLEFVWFCREAIRGLGSRSHIVLATLVLFEFGTSMAFLQFIRKNGGAPEGGYGLSYRVQEERGITWEEDVQKDLHID